MTEAVAINIPEPDPNVRSPTDALRLTVSAAIAVATTIVTFIFPEVFGGLGTDLDAILDDAGGAVTQIVGLVVTALVLAVPIIILAYFVRRRDVRRIVIVAAAAVLGAGITATCITWISAVLGDSIPTPEAGTVVVAQTMYYPYVAALSAAITAAAPWMPRRWQRVSWAALAAVVLVRLALGSNLPAELVLALSFGVAAGSGILWGLGSPNRRPTGGEIVATLQRAGIEPVRLDAAQVDARGSTPYFVEMNSGDRLFVKTLSTDERSADLLFRIYRRLRFKNVGDEPAFSSLRRAVEHEALLSHSASAAGVRTPQIIAVGRIGDEDYSMLLAYSAIEGRSLDAVEPQRLTDDTLRSTWHQVAILHAHGIAHRDLRLANVFIDDDDSPWLIDFGFSELAASQLLIDNDIAEFLVSSALIVGPERSVHQAAAVLGTDRLALAARRLQPHALSGATRRAVKDRGDRLDLLIRHEIGSVSQLPPADLDRITRVRRRSRSATR